MPAPPPPEPPKQPEKAPDQDVFKQRNQNQAQQFASMAGNQSTLLSGTGGVASSSQNLGKSTLLGS